MDKDRMTQINLNTIMGNLDGINSLGSSQNISSTNAANTAKASGTTDENSLAEYSSNTEETNFSSYDEKINYRKQEIEDCQEAIIQYEKLVETQEDKTEALKKELEEKENKKEKIQSEIDSLDKDDEVDMARKAQLQMIISGINNDINILNVEITDSNNKQIELEMNLGFAQIYLNKAQSRYNETVQEKALAEQKAAAEAAAANSFSYNSPTTENTQNSGTANASNNSASGGKTSQAGIDIIKKSEGCMLKAYKCPAGVSTIGYGHTGGVSMGQTITQEQAEQFLKDDLAEFENYVTKYAKEANCNLTQGQFDALVCFSYNLGPGVLKSSGILNQIAKGDIQGAKNTMLKYDHAKVNGKMVVLKGLTVRRQEEAAML